MPDEKPAGLDPDENDVDLLGDEPEEVTSKPVGTGVAVLAFLALALFSALVATAVRKGTFHLGSPAVPLEAQIRKTELLNEINTQRDAMNLPPLAGEPAGESMEDMAMRLKKDADLISATAAGYQKLIEERTNALAAKNEEFLKSEQLRDSLAAERSRLKTELQQALVGGSDNKMLRQDFENLKKDLMATSEKLSAAEEKIKVLQATPAADDYADLKRRFDETLRAKEFFENRVKQLEGTAPK